METAINGTLRLQSDSLVSGLHRLNHHFLTLFNSVRLLVIRAQLATGRISLVTDLFFSNLNHLSKLDPLFKLTMMRCKKNSPMPYSNSPSWARMRIM